MFDNEKLKLINAMKEKDLIIYIWIRLLIQAGKNNDGGLIYLNKSTPFSDEMLSTIFDRPVGAIKNALVVLEKLKMIKRDKKGFIKILNWEKHQNVDGLERVREQSRNRMRRMRERKKSKASGCVTVTQQLDNVTIQNKKEIIDKDSNILDKEIENKKKDKEIETESKNGFNNDGNIIDKNNVVEIGQALKNKQVDILNQTAANIISYYEDLLGKIGIFNYGAIVIDLEMYGEEWLRCAIDKAIEQNKLSINYVNGILRNWKVNGYPKGDVHCAGGDIRQNNNEFENFKPKEARRLTEGEQKKAEGKLI